MGLRHLQWLQNGQLNELKSFQLSRTVEMSPWSSAQQLCQQNMGLINYGNELINPLLFTGRKGTWKHWGTGQSGALPGQLHSPTGSYNALLEAKSMLVQHPLQRAAFPCSGSTWQNSRIWKIMTVTNLHHKEVRNTQSFWPSHFLGKSLNLRVSLSPKLDLIVLEEQSRKETTLLCSLFLSKAQELMTVLTTH